VERERATQVPLLVFDTGGTFLKNLEDATNAPLVELTTGAMVEGLGKIGYDALNLGRAELLLPPELLRKLAATAAFPLLSANIADAAGKAPFTGWIVKEVGGLRVGIFGVSGDQPLGLSGLPGGDLTVRDPVAAARAAVAELRRTADLVVALSQLGLERDARLAREVPGIDIILGGFTRQVTPTPRIEGTTMILQVGAKGMQLGRLGLRIIPGREGAWTAHTAARGGEARVYDWTLVPLSAALADHPALAALLERHREELRSRNLAQLAIAQPPRAPPAPARPAFVGAAACGSCHPAQLRQWAASKHAGALAALERKRQELNPECVRCHVTGYGDSGGYRIGATNGVDMGNVQCEACHGFGREHRGKGKIRGTVPEAVCRRCHSTENSPTFKYEPYLKLLGEHASRHFTGKRAPASPGVQR
jgi:hypothetical protein